MPDIAFCPEADGGEVAVVLLDQLDGFVNKGPLRVFINRIPVLAADGAQAYACYKTGTAQHDTLVDHILGEYPEYLAVVYPCRAGFLSVRSNADAASHIAVFILNFLDIELQRITGSGADCFQLLGGIVNGTVPVELGFSIFGKESVDRLIIAERIACNGQQHVSALIEQLYARYDDPAVRDGYPEVLAPGVAVSGSPLDGGASAYPVNGDNRERIIALLIGRLPESVAPVKGAYAVAPDIDPDEHRLIPYLLTVSGSEHGVIRIIGIAIVLLQNAQVAVGNHRAVGNYLDLCQGKAHAVDVESIGIKPADISAAYRDINTLQPRPGTVVVYIVLAAVRVSELAVANHHMHPAVIGCVLVIDTQDIAVVEIHELRRAPGGTVGRGVAVRVGTGDDLGERKLSVEQL